jgi:hypothetical protein
VSSTQKGVCQLAKVRRIVMHTRTFKEAKNAFNQDPTSKTAWNYLVTAVEYGADDLIDQRMFLLAVSEVAGYIDHSSRGRVLVERLLLASASIRLACEGSPSPGTMPGEVEQARPTRRRRGSCRSQIADEGF